MANYVGFKLKIEECSKKEEVLKNLEVLMKEKYVHETNYKLIYMSEEHNVFHSEFKNFFVSEIDEYIQELSKIYPEAVFKCAYYENVQQWRWVVFLKNGEAILDVEEHDNSIPSIFYADNYELTVQ